MSIQKIFSTSKIKYFSLAACFLFTFLIQPLVFSPAVKAASGEAVADRAYTWALISFWRKNKCDITTSLSVEGASDLNNLFKLDGNSEIGLHVKSNGENATCKETATFLKTILPEWGFDPNDPIGFLKAVGYLEPNSTNNPSNYYHLSGGTVESIINIIPDDFFANGSRSEASDDVLYYIYYYHFIDVTKGCKASYKGSYDSLTETERAKADSGLEENGGYWLVLSNGVNPSNTTEKAVYFVGNSKSHRVAVGYGVQSGDGILTCSEISDWLASNPSKATAYAETIKYQEENGITSTTGTSPTDSNTADTCEGGIPVLGWLICSIIDQVSKFAGWVDNQIADLLRIDSQIYEKDSGLKTAWSAIRIIATVILVGIALFMIIAQIFNFDAMSAYTIKKLVPRLVIAAILMQLSWFIFTSLIAVVNVLGDGIGELLAAPFGGADKLSTLASIINNFYVNASGGSQAVAFTFLGIGVAGGIVAIGGGFGILALVLSILIAAFMAFVTLVLRRVVVIALLVISPIALVAWILPNTQKWWSNYWGLISKLLLMYPLIMGLLMVGKIFAAISAKSYQGGASDSVTFFIILLAYFGPFFFIPSTFKFAGGLFAKAAGAINGMGSKLQSADIGGFKKQAEANKKMREERKFARGAEWLNRNPQNGGVDAMRYWQGRWRTKTLGGALFMPDAKRTAEQRVLRAAQAGEEVELKNAQMEFSAATAGISGDDLKKDQEKIVNTRTGDVVTLSNGRKIRVTEQVERVNLASALTLRNTKVIDNFTTAIKDAAGNTDASIARDRTATLNKFIQSNFKDLDEQMPDLSRGKSLEHAGVFPKAVSTYHNLDSDPGQRQEQVRRILKGMGTSTRIKDKRAFTGYINSLAQNENISEQALQAIIKNEQGTGLSQLDPQLKHLENIDLSLVRASDGNIRIQYNEPTGTYEMASSTSPPSATTPASVATPGGSTPSSPTTPPSASP